jgi:hypothetical protein
MFTDYFQFIQINELAMASDAKRLQLFSEIAGSMVWAEKRPEDVNLLDGKYNVNEGCLFI